MELADFMNVPESQVPKRFFWYEVEKRKDIVTLKYICEGERFVLLKQAVEKSKSRDEPHDLWGSYLEFGFGSGDTLNFIAAIANNAFVYGFESGNGINNDPDVCNRPFAYTKTVDLEIRGKYKDEYGDDGTPIDKEGLLSLVLRRRTSEQEKPFVPFTPLCNVQLCMGDIKNTLPVFISQEMKKPNRPNHVSFMFIDTANPELTTKIISMLADYVIVNKTIIVSDNRLESLEYKSQRPEMPNYEPIQLLTQHMPGLINLEDFIQKPYEAAAKSAEQHNIHKIEAGRNVLHFNSKDRLDKFYSNASMVSLRKRLEEAKARALMSDSEILQFAVETARDNFKDEPDILPMYLEFGFCTGRTINFMATQLEANEQIYGFDTGTGLPHAWRYKLPKGLFRYTKRLHKDAATGTLTLTRIPFVDTEKQILSQDAFIPFVPDKRVSLVIGDVRDTLGTFVKKLKQNTRVVLIHIDTDLRSAAECVLSELRQHIVLDKTVVVFDEAFNFDGVAARDAPNTLDEWMKHEFRAMENFRGSSAWHPIAYNENGQQLVVTFS